MKAPKTLRKIPKLPADATLRTIADGLADRVEYVRRVLGQMTGFGGEVQVRLGIWSNPKYPDYIVEMLFFEDDNPVQPAGSAIMNIYSGRTHKAYDVGAFAIALVDGGLVGDGTPLANFIYSRENSSMSQR